MSASGSSGAAGSEISDGPDRGDGGGSEVMDPCMLDGVDIGLEGGEACRRRLVRRDAKNAIDQRVEVSFVVYDICKLAVLRLPIVGIDYINQHKQAFANLADQHR